MGDAGPEGKTRSSFLEMWCLGLSIPVGLGRWLEMQL